MVTLTDNKGYGNAKRVRHADFSPAEVTRMTSVTCDKCGYEYSIQHRIGQENVGLASRQAVWLADHFVWDHIQENKHQGSIRLPFLAEVKPH